MKPWVHLLYAVAASVTFALGGQDCLVFTEPRRLMTTAPGLVEEKLDEKTGRYAAVMNNGDHLLAKFEPCDLGLRVHYLLSSKLNDADKLKTIRWLLGRILPSKILADHVLPQLDKHPVADFRKPVLLKGLNDTHMLLIQAPSSPLFHSEIYYEWIPPEH